MKKIFATALVSLSLLALSGVAFAQEVAVRSGVITAIKPVQGAVAPQSQSSETGRRLGGILGRAVGAAVNHHTGYYYGYEAANAGQAIGEAVGSSKQASSATSAYLIMVRFDEGGSSAIKQASANGLQVGAHVQVMGSGNDAEVVAD